MKTKLKNEEKIKRYLSYRLDRKVTKEEFEDVINYFEEVAEFIQQERENNTLIREKASLELEIDNEFYEVWVTYDSIIEDNNKIMLIDFDYTYDSFIDNLSFY